MNEPVVPAAVHETAAPAPAPTISATRDAANKGDFTAFDAAHIAAKSGKPLAPVTAEPAPTEKVEAPAEQKPDAAAPLQAATVSKRQQQINDYERRIAEQDQRIRALESQMTRPAAPAQSPTAPQQQQQAPEPPTWQDSVRTPDISREMVSEAQFFEQFPDAPYAAYGAYVSRYFTAAEHAEAHSRAQEQQLTEAQQKRVEGFIAKLDAAKVADPEFINKLTPEVRGLKPFSALAPGEAGGPLNVVAEQVFDSPIADKVLLHFSQHPEALQRLQSMPPEIQAIRDASARARAHMQFIVREFNKLEGRLEAASEASAPAPAAPAPSTISAALPPPPTLTKAGASTDPKQAALARGDVATFERLDLQTRAGRRGLVTR